MLINTILALSLLVSGFTARLTTTVSSLHLPEKIAVITNYQNLKDNLFPHVVYKPSPQPGRSEDLALEGGAQGSGQSGQVLAAETANPDFVFNVNVPATFKETATFDKAIVGNTFTAPNVIYSIVPGTGITVSSGQNPTLAVALTAGSGISISGATITNSGITSLTAGSGISVSGSTVTNSDLGSSQNIFKNMAVSGQTTIAAGSNSDTLTFVSGTGLTITTDSTNKKLTFTPDFTTSGWSRNSTNGYIYLTTSTDKVGIGTTAPSTALYVSGASTLAGAVTLGSASTDSITFTGRVKNGTSLLPDTDLGSDLGASGKRFNNLWVANINSNSSQSFSGQTTFSYAPTDTTIAQASVLINPTTSATNGQLLGFGIAGYQRALIDNYGDIILGYNGNTSAPVTSYPLTVYGRNSTMIHYVDTSGNGYFAGNVGIGTTSPTKVLDVNGDVNIATGKAYYINGTSVLNGTTLGTGVVTSSLTTVGALASGSIASGFGNISTANTITTSGTMGTAATTTFTGATGTFSTSTTSPLVIGGTGVGSSLSLQSTSGIGSSDFIKFLVGNNGGTEAT